MMNAKYASAGTSPMTSTACSSSSSMRAKKPFSPRARRASANTIQMMGQPSPVRSRSAPVKLAVMSGTLRCHAIAASTANSGSTWTHASSASASPCAT